MSDYTYDDVQAGRHKRLAELVDIHHNRSYDDYNDTYDEFELVFLGETTEGEQLEEGEERQPIPKYASIAHDETYGMIHLFDDITQALHDQANVPDNGEYLNVPGGIIDLDTGEVIETRSVVLTKEAYQVLCGLVQPSWMNAETPEEEAKAVNASGIFADVWDELRTAFPLADFRNAVIDGDIEYDEEAGL